RRCSCSRWLHRHHRDGLRRRALRPVGRRQEHVDPMYQPARDDRQRRDPRRGRLGRRREHESRHAPFACGYGVPELRAVSAPDGARQHQPRADPRPEARCRHRDRPVAGAARAGRPDRPRAQIAGRPLRRTAAADRDRPRARHGPGGHALRRTHLGPRPGDDRRGPGCDGGAGARWHDDGRRHARNGVRAAGRRSGAVYGSWSNRRGSGHDRVLYGARHRARPRISVEDARVKATKKPWRSDLPRYQQIADELVAQIGARVYPDGGLLPTEMELCAHYAASRSTVREALRRVRDAGLISRRRKTGTAVVAQVPPVSYRQPTNAITDLLQYAENTKIEILSERRVICDAPLANLLECREGHAWLKVTSLRTAPGDPRPMAMT